MINMELSTEELALIKMLLMKEEIQTRIEIHHAKQTFEYRDYLKSRHKEISRLLEKISGQKMEAAA
jgi:hypothetical protein